jgi:hypothetical protein
MRRVFCPIFLQPFPLALCPRRTVENVLLRKSAVVERVFELAQLRRPRAVATHFSYSSREPNDKSKSVLQVESAGVLDEPGVPLRIFQGNPR